MATFTRTGVAPAGNTWPFGPSPLTSRSEGNKVEIRPTLGRGVQWTESWSWVDGQNTTVRAHLLDCIWYHSAGTTVTLKPWSHRVSGGTVAVDAAGTVNGASQAGTSLITAGWSPSAGTFKKGDYIIIAGLAAARWITADATASGGAATLSIWPSIPVGSEPADTAVVTLNGDMTCEIVDVPKMPAGRPAGSSSGGVTEIYRGLTVKFNEAV